jgi:hypothetical protein
MVHRWHWSGVVTQKRISTRRNVNVELTARLKVQRRNRATTENTSALHATRHPSLRIWVVTVVMMMLKMASTYRGTHQGFSLEHFISARLLVLACLGVYWAMVTLARRMHIWGVVAVTVMNR